MTNPRATKDWIRAVASYMNLSLSDLAVKAGLSPSTITRFMNDGSGKLTITERTLDAVANYTGVPKNVLPGHRSIPGLGEGEAVPYQPHIEKLPDWVETAIAAHKGNRNGIDAWIMKGWPLDLLGILPGDILLIDQNRRAKGGDIVCAQLTDLATGMTETVMRRYDPPFLTTHSAKSGPSRPEQVDDDRVIIMGVECGVIRPRN